MRAKSCSTSSVPCVQHAPKCPSSRRAERCANHHHLDNREPNITHKGRTVHGVENGTVLFTSNVTSNAAASSSAACQSHSPSEREPV
jgi:hypothetical protein